MNVLSLFQSFYPLGEEHQGRRASLRFALAPGYLIFAPSALRWLPLDGSPDGTFSCTTTVETAHDLGKLVSHGDEAAV